MLHVKALICSIILLIINDSACLDSKRAVLSVHEHELRQDISVKDYESEVSGALRELKIPGLLQARLLKGFKGERATRYAILWVWESEDVIKQNFGTVEQPTWPAEWLRYEDEILAKYLICHPDEILFTAYNVVNEVNYHPCSE